MGLKKGAQNRNRSTYFEEVSGAAPTGCFAPGLLGVRDNRFKTFQQWEVLLLYYIEKAVIWMSREKEKSINMSEVSITLQFTRDPHAVKVRKKSGKKNNLLSCIYFHFHRGCTAG